jgi:hypothetical protein
MLNGKTCVYIELYREETIIYKLGGEKLITMIYNYRWKR